MYVNDIKVIAHSPFMSCINLDADAQTWKYNK
jgi:hypothetical protein